MQKKYFPSLEVLRFFAFFKVYLQHVPKDFDTPLFSYLKSGGGIGVSFFFVLSGFLITYLLLIEKANNATIDIKRFLIRRSLRIWPLYFLLVFVAFAIPDVLKQFIGMNAIGHGYEFDWRFSFSFLENYKMILEDNVPKTAHLSTFWSLCIEEHFYLLWIFALYFLSYKNIKYYLFSSIPIAWLARYLEFTFSTNTTITTNDLFTNIDFFAVGGLLAYWIVSNATHFENTLLKIATPVKKALVLTVIVAVIFQSFVFPYNSQSALNTIFRSSFIALAFTVLIAMFVPEKSGLLLKNKTLTYLGKISYGLYVFHVLINQFFLKVYRYYFDGVDNWFKLSTYMLITLACTILISHLSYKYFERPFLKLRERF